MESANQGGVSLTELTGVSSGHGLREGLGEAGTAAGLGRRSWIWVGACWACSVCQVVGCASGLRRDAWAPGKSGIADRDRKGTLQAAGPRAPRA